MLPFGQQRLEGVDPGLGLSLACLGGHANPLEFTLEGPPAGTRLFLLRGQPAFFLFQPRGVVPLPGDARAAIEFQDPTGDVVEEIAVVGHGDHCTGERLEVAFQPSHGLGIQVVGGLIQQEHVRLLQQDAAQGHSPRLAARQGGHLRLAWWQPQGIHGDVDRPVEVPGTRDIDAGLQFTLLVEQGLHFLVRHRFGEARA